MRSIISFVLFGSLCLIGVWAKPICEDTQCKANGNFIQVDCNEKFKFKHHSAKCFMNDNAEFIIMSDSLVKQAKLSAANVADSNVEGKVEIRRLKRSVAGEEDLRAEVLSARELKDLMKKSNEVATESPLNTNEVSPSGTDTAGEDEEKPLPVVGIIFVISTGDEETNEVAKSHDTAASLDAEDELGEALFGLLLLGAILEEVKKQQLENAEE